MYNSQGRRSRFRSLLISVLVCAAWSCDESKNWKQQAENSGNTTWNIMLFVRLALKQKTDCSAKYKPLECCCCISQNVTQFNSTSLDARREHLSRDRNCFSIVDCAPNNLQLTLKEAMNIKWENPTLNKQLKHADLTLSFLHYSLCIIIILIFSEHFVI